MARPTLQLKAKLFKICAPLHFLLSELCLKQMPRPLPLVLTFIWLAAECLYMEMLLVFPGRGVTETAGV